MENIHTILFLHKTSMFSLRLKYRILFILTAFFYVCILSLGRWFIFIPKIAYRDNILNYFLDLDLNTCRFCHPTYM